MDVLKANGSMNRIANLFEVVVVLSILSVVVGQFGRFHFLPDLISHFRIQATVALLVAGAALWWLGRPRWAAVAGISGTMLLLLLLQYLPLQNPPEPADYRLFLMNVLTKNERKSEVIEQIRSKDPDFVVLLETDANWIDAVTKGLGEDWQYRKSVPRSDNFGIAVFSKVPFEDTEVKEFSISRLTPSICATFDLDGKQFRLVGVHPVPPMNPFAFDARNELFTGLSADVIMNNPQHTIVAGDFNCTPWSPWFYKLCRDTNLENSMKGQGLGVSWTPFKTQLIGLPIDHVLAGSNIAVVSRDVGEWNGSDHRSVCVDFRID